MSRLPAVADRFYPGDKQQLDDIIQELLKKAKTSKIQGAIGVVSPHAGYVYSGHVAAEVLGSVDIPETVIVIGPNHHGRGPSLSLSRRDWEMPAGVVPINVELSEILLEGNSDIATDDIAHRYEHSLEVQIPFLQALQENLRIVPLALSQLPYPTCEKLGTSLAEAIRRYAKPVLMVASSDMSHYEPRKVAEKQDTMALDRLTNLDPEGLYTTVLANRISMCGIIAVTVVLQASLLLGADRAEILRYTDSGEISGDTDKVVGYAGAVISKR